MKALTLHQPWATLIAVGYKTIETRSWSTRYRGPLAIHAAKAIVPGGLDLARSYLDPGQRIAMPHGAVVATSELIACVPIVDGTKNFDTPCLVIDSPVTETTTHVGAPGTLSLFEDELVDIDVSGQWPFGDFQPGRFAWILVDIKALDEALPATGRQQLWEWNP
jgi:hypothetical protein